MTSSIYVYSIDKKEVHRITDEANFDNEPVFSTDGKYIFFKSSRNFNQVGMINEDDIIYANLNKIYAVSLEKDTPSITAPESDEEESGEKEDDENKDEDGKENIKIRFDFDGISDRVVDLPIPSGNYINLQVYGDNLFYFSFPLSTFNNHEQLTLHLFDLKEKKDKIIISGFDDLSISYSGDKFIYRSGNTFGVCDASSEGKSIGDGVLNTDGVSMMVDYREEWKEIFNEAWRMERDYFYDLGMNGVD
jgi:tricorn protease